MNHANLAIGHRTLEATPECAAIDWRGLYLCWYKDIERAYTRLGHGLGFNPPILSSIRAFEGNPRLLLLGLNPAGSRDYPNHRGRFRYEEQDHYIGTSWDDFPVGQAPLQRQVRLLLRHIQRRLGDDGPLDLFARDRVVEASFVPFRSPREADLHNRKASMAFARQLWGGIISRWQPKYAVCFGATPFTELCELLGRVIEVRDYDPCWQGALRVRKFESGARVLGLPHMSHFPIFGRGVSELAIDLAFNDLFAE